MNQIIGTNYLCVKYIIALISDCASDRLTYGYLYANRQRKAIRIQGVDLI